MIHMIYGQQVGVELPVKGKPLMLTASTQLCTRAELHTYLEMPCQQTAYNGERWEGEPRGGGSSRACALCRYITYMHASITHGGMVHT